MPRPFPFPLNVGTDICKVSRIARILNKSHDHARRLWERVLSPYEANRDRHMFEMLYPPPSKTAWKNLELKTPSILLAGKDEGNRAESLPATTLEEDNLDQPMEKAQPRKTPVGDAVEYENQLRQLSMFLAGRFAAKEAVMKAHHSRRLTWHDIEIEKSGPLLSSKPGHSQPPYAVVFGGPDRTPDTAQTVPISISHDGDYATASAIAMAHEAESSIVRRFFKGLSTPPRDGEAITGGTNITRKDLVGVTKAFEFVADRLESLEHRLEKMESLEKKLEQMEERNRSRAEPQPSISQILRDVTPEELEIMIQEEQIIQGTVEGILAYTNTQQDSPRGSRKLLRVENLPSDLDQSQLEKLFNFSKHKLLNSWLCKKASGNTSIGVAFFQYDSPPDRDFPGTQELDTIIEHLGGNPVFANTDIHVWAMGNKSLRSLARGRKARAVIAARARSRANVSGKVRARILRNKEILGIFHKFESTMKGEA